MSLGVFQKGFQVLTLGGQVLVFLLYFDFFQAPQLAQAHVEDGFRLHLGQVELFHHQLFGVILFADDADDLIQVEESDEETAEDFQAPFDLLQAVLGTPHQDDLAVVEVGLQHIAQVHHPRR